MDSEEWAEFGNKPEKVNGKSCDTEGDENEWDVHRTVSQESSLSSNFNKLLINTNSHHTHKNLSLNRLTKDEDNPRMIFCPTTSMTYIVKKAQGAFLSLKKQKGKPSYYKHYPNLPPKLVFGLSGTPDLMN